MAECGASPQGAGKVYFVGAGVGGSDYLTLRACHLLAVADIAIYDDLIDPSVLAWLPSGCQRLWAGKRGGQHSTSQDEINDLLVRSCQRGQRVVRLKSGDPGIFGRIVPEIEALRAAGCAFELVPGLSSAIAAPLFAGIPLTEADLSPCFAVLTGHDPDRLPWEAIAAMPTLSILMGTARVADLCARLCRYKPAGTPAALVQWCGTPRQQVWKGTLASLPSLLPDRSLSPAVILVGEVVRLASQMVGERDTVSGDAVAPASECPDSIYSPHPSMPPAMPQPLAGKTIVVTRAAEQAGSFTALLQSYGATVVDMPTLAILPPSCWEPLDGAIAHLQDYDWLVLASANAVESFFSRLHLAGGDSRALAGLKVAVVGRKTAESLATFGIAPDLIPPHYIADALAEVFPVSDGLQVLFPRVESGGREALVEQLTRRGAMVTSVAAYESGCPDAIDPHALATLQGGRADAIAFASSKTVRHCAQLLDRVADAATWRSWLARTHIASIGPQTSATCREIFGRVEIEAAEFTLDGLATAIVRAFEPAS